MDFSWVVRRSEFANIVCMCRECIYGNIPAGEERGGTKPKRELIWHVRQLLVSWDDGYHSLGNADAQAGQI